MGLFRKGRTRTIAKFHRTDLVIYDHSRKGKTPPYNKVNTVSAIHTRKFLCHRNFSKDILAKTLLSWSKLFVTEKCSKETLSNKVRQ